MLSVLSPLARDTVAKRKPRSYSSSSLSGGRHFRERTTGSWQDVAAEASEGDVRFEALNITECFSKLGKQTT